MFTKKQPKLTWVINAVHENKEGTGLTVTPAGVMTERLTINEMEEYVNKANTEMFNRLRNDVKGHDIEIGVLASSFVHVIHEDEVIKDEKYQETKIKILKASK
jgi:hypothetical protein